MACLIVEFYHATNQATVALISWCYVTQVLGTGSVKYNYRKFKTGFLVYAKFAYVEYVSMSNTDKLEKRIEFLCRMAQIFQI